MSAFHLKIATPDGAAFDGSAARLVLRGSEGELAVLAGHAPFVTAVKPGPCRVLLEDGTERSGHLDGGLLAVSGEGAVLLSGSFRW